MARLQALLALLLLLAASVPHVVTGLLELRRQEEEPALSHSSQVGGRTASGEPALCALLAWWGGAGRHSATRGPCGPMLCQSLRISCLPTVWFMQRLCLLYAVLRPAAVAPPKQLSCNANPPRWPARRGRAGLGDWLQRRPLQNLQGLALPAHHLAPNHPAHRLDPGHQGMLVCSVCRNFQCVPPKVKILFPRSGTLTQTKLSFCAAHVRPPAHVPRPAPSRLAHVLPVPSRHARARPAPDRPLVPSRLPPRHAPWEACPMTSATTRPSLPLQSSHSNLCSLTKFTTQSPRPRSRPPSSELPCGRVRAGRWEAAASMRVVALLLALPTSSCFCFATPGWLQSGQLWLAGVGAQHVGDVQRKRHHRWAHLHRRHRLHCHPGRVRWRRRAASQPAGDRRAPRVQRAPAALRPARGSTCAPPHIPDGLHAPPPPGCAPRLLPAGSALRNSRRPGASACRPAPWFSTRTAKYCCSLRWPGQPTWMATPLWCMSATAPTQKPRPPIPPSSA